MHKFKHSYLWSLDALNPESRSVTGSTCNYKAPFNVHSAACNNSGAVLDQHRPQVPARGRAADSSRREPDKTWGKLPLAISLPDPGKFAEPSLLSLQDLPEEIYQNQPAVIERHENIGKGMDQSWTNKSSNRHQVIVQYATS